jgi:uncharacterized protein DUF5670
VAALVDDQRGVETNGATGFNEGCNVIGPGRLSKSAARNLSWQLCCKHFVSAGIRDLATEPVTEKEGAMLWTIAVILLVLWALGMVSSYTAGGLVHLLLVIAVVVVFQFINGRRSI